MKILSAALTGVIMSAALIQLGCSGSGSSGSSTDSSLGLSGTLGTVSLLSDNSTMAIDTSNLKIQAIAFTSPPTIVTTDVGSDGKFNVILPNSKGAAASAYFLDKTDNSKVGTIVFEDSSSKDMNGKTSQTSSVVLGASVNLGSINLGTDGKVKVPVSTIAAQLSSSSSVAASTAFDPSGVWYMKAFTGSLPSGYQTVTSDCTHDGPCIGFAITLTRFTGKKFTPNAGQCDATAFPVVCNSTTDGTIGTADRYALSIWGSNYANGIGACGSKTGFTAAEARALAGIHIATLPTIGGQTMAFGPYVYNHAAGFGGDSAPFNKDWMKTGATSSHPVQECRPVPISNAGVTYNGWACRGQKMTGAWPGSPASPTAYGWQVGIEGGGCFNTATNKPVNVTNFATLGIGTCATTDVSSTYGSGFFKNTCTFTNVDHDNDSSTPAISLSCANIGGQVTDSSGTPTSTPMTFTAGQFLGAPTNMASSGATCASIGSADDAHTLAAYRCYAEAYWSAGGSTATCAREFNFNWSATTPVGFAQDNDRGKPKNAFITNILSYSPDGQTATLEDENITTITIPTGASSSTFCKASRRTVLSFQKQSATRLLIDLRQSGQMDSTDAACIGAAKDALAGKNVGGGNLQDTLTPQNLMFFADTSL